MSQSILTSVKKTLNLAEDDPSFDLDVVLHINSTLATLTQLGVGPVDGFEIVDSTETWEDFLGTNKRFNFVKSYVYLKVRMLFDPPTTSSLGESFQKQLDEYVWRISVVREGDSWIDPTVPVV